MRSRAPYTCTHMRVVVVHDRVHVRLFPLLIDNNVFL